MERIEKTIEKKDISYGETDMRRSVLDQPFEDIDYAEVLYYVDWYEDEEVYIYSTETLRIYDKKGRAFNYSEGSGIHAVTSSEYTGDFPDPRKLVIFNDRIDIKY